MTKYIIIGSVSLLVIVMSYFRTKRAKSKVVCVNVDNCTGCQLCLKKCRHKAITVVKDEERRYILIDAKKCTACGDCIPACKFNALELIDRKSI